MDMASFPGCCGARVLAGMTARTPNTILHASDYIDDKVRRFGPNSNPRTRHPNGKIFLATMTDGQIETCPEFVAILKKRGFKLRNRWLNNSGTWCNLLVLETSGCGSALKDSPWNAK